MTKLLKLLDALLKRSLFIKWAVPNYSGDVNLSAMFGTLDAIEIRRKGYPACHGSIYSVQGAPSYRQSEVTFVGEIEDGKLKASYKDEGWEYTGNIELAFGNGMIAANITRNEVEIIPMWGIPEGKSLQAMPIQGIG